MIYFGNSSQFSKLAFAELCFKRLFIGAVLSLTVIACQPQQKSNQASVEAEKRTNKKKTRQSASVVVLNKNQSDGQFWTQARVNTGSVRFLVDTGAGLVALTELDAKKAGIKTRNLTYDVPIRTAGGKNFAASVILDRISVGAITVKDVEALVVPKGLDISLLGMTYLGELQSVEATKTSLTLRY